MEKIRVNTKKSYDVLIGDNLLEECGQLIRTAASPQMIALITDDIVDGLYSERVLRSLTESGFKAIKFVIPHGESSKNAHYFIKLLNFLAENKLTRKDLIVALGGGVVGDLSGFAASAYLRGIDFVQIPTTLLAMVDSSVGGKVAIDLDAGKNLAGAFYQPKLVICDKTALGTLPDDIFIDGCAEVIKYAFIGNSALYSHLNEYGKDFNREYVISKCIEQKRDIVEKDELDTGLRNLLNFGHTIGHAVEKLSDFNVSHGKAVAIGMCTISKAAAKANICSLDTPRLIEKLIESFSLPTKNTFTCDEIYNMICSDKKLSGDTITLILPESISKCGMYPYKISEVKEFIKEGL